MPGLIGSIRVDQDAVQEGWRNSERRGYRINPHSKGEKDRAEGVVAGELVALERIERERSVFRHRVCRMVDEQIEAAKRNSPTWNKLKAEEEGERE